MSRSKTSRRRPAAKSPAPAPAPQPCSGRALVPRDLLALELRAHMQGVVNIVGCLIPQRHEIPTTVIPWLDVAAALICEACEMLDGRMAAGFTISQAHPENDIVGHACRLWQETFVNSPEIDLIDHAAVLVFCQAMYSREAALDAATESAAEDSI